MALMFVTRYVTMLAQFLMMIVRPPPLTRRCVRLSLHSMRSPPQITALGAPRHPVGT